MAQVYDDRDYVTSVTFYCNKCKKIVYDGSEADYENVTDRQDTFDFHLCKKCHKKLWGWLKVGIEISND